MKGMVNLCNQLKDETTSSLTQARQQTYASQSFQSGYAA
jgi:hypothetical protein